MLALFADGAIVHSPLYGTLPATRVLPGAVRRHRLGELTLLGTMRGTSVEGRALLSFLFHFDWVLPNGTARPVRRRRRRRARRRRADQQHPDRLRHGRCPPRVRGGHRHGRAARRDRAVPASVACAERQVLIAPSMDRLDEAVDDAGGGHEGVTRSGRSRATPPGATSSVSSSRPAKRGFDHLVGREQPDEDHGRDDASDRVDDGQRDGPAPRPCRTRIAKPISSTAMPRQHRQPERPERRVRASAGRRRRVRARARRTAAATRHDDREQPDRAAAPASRELDRARSAGSCGELSTVHSVSGFQLGVVRSMTANTSVVQNPRWTATLMIAAPDAARTHRPRDRPRADFRAAGRAGHADDDDRQRR